MAVSTSTTTRAAQLALVLLALTGCQPPLATGRSVQTVWVLDRLGPTPPLAAPATSGFEPAGAASSAPQVVPTSPPTTGGAGNGPAAGPSGHFQGHVLDLADRPIAGATVRTADGRRAVSDADGAFTLPGAFPADGAFVASHPAYVAKAIAQLSAGDALTLHLQPRSEETVEPTIEPDRAFQVRGHLVDPAGLPVEGVWVAIGDSRGAAAVPVQTDGAGWFELTVFATLPRLADATLVAAGSGGMAVATGLNAAPSAPFLDFDATDTAPVSPLVLVPTTRTVAIAVDDGGMNASRSVEIAAGSVHLSLDASGPTFAWAPQAGLSATLHVETSDADHGVASEFVHGLDATETRVTDALLAPPSFVASPALAPGEAVSWAPVSGVGGYALLLSGELSGGPLWEAFTPANELALSLDAPLPAGPYTLALTALQADGLAPRTVAAVGPRHFTLSPGTTRYKRATRTLHLNRP